MSGTSSRKPSGSSTNSRAHSPLSSSNHTQSHRNLSPSNMYGVGIGNSNGLKSLNSGWQVWGSSASIAKRNASVHSAPNGTDLPQPDNNYRTHLGDGWTQSRSSSGAWDEELQQKDFPSIDIPSLPAVSHHTRPLTVHTSMTQTTFSAPGGDDRSLGSKSGPYSPHGCDTSLSKDGPRFPLAPSPTRVFPMAYSDQSSTTPNGPVHPPSATTNNLAPLTLALRGMAVEDGNNTHQNPHHSRHHRGPPMPQARPYGAFTQGDYNAYYPHPGREPYLDYQYGYPPSDPSLYGSPVVTAAPLYQGVAAQIPHLNAVPDMQPQPGIFYEFRGARQNSQFYYPSHQAAMYPHTLSPMVASRVAGSLADKKHEMQLATQALVYGTVRSTPSPHPQIYPTPLDFTPPLPIMMSGPVGVYGLNPLHVYQQNIRPARRSNVINPVTTLRSRLLDEFRANKARKWEFRDIFGYIVEFSGDQHGSRFIQQKLETATTDEKQTVFDEIVPANTLQLIQDVFGNYVIQKLFEHGTQVQKACLANTMEGHALSLSLQMYGCRVVQKAIEYILPEQQNIFVRELEPHVLRCVKDSNGNHVIQKLIERVSPDRLEFVQMFRGNVFELATHPYGCRVLQRCLEHLPEDNMRPLMDELHTSAINLMQDQFGNYVIQYVLEHGKPQDQAIVIAKLRGQMLQMARHKFASNVCEKALVCAESEIRRLLIDEMMISAADGVSPTTAMMKDQYANYVLQRALTVADVDQKEALVNRIKPQLASMRKYSSAYSKHLTSIERVIDKHALQKFDSSLPQLAVIPPTNC